MKRTSEFDKTKLTQVANNKSVVAVYVDPFPIEMIKLRFAEFENAQNSVSIYLSFEDTLRIAEDVKSGKIFKDIQSSNYPIQVTHGGTPANRANRADHKAEARLMTFGMQKDKVYVNAQSGPGKELSTGFIQPDGNPENKISVGMSIEDFRGMFIYTAAAINAYLPTLVNQLVSTAEKNRFNN